MRKILISTTVLVILSILLLLVPIGFLVNTEVTFPIIWSVFGGDADSIYAGKIIGFIDGKSDVLPSVLIESEITHMKDVRDVFVMAKTAMALMLSVLLGFIVYGGVDWNFVLRRLRFVLLCLPLIIVIFFPFVFNLSHQLLFTAGSWIFDAATTTLVNVFTTGFFVGIGVLWMLSCWALGALTHSILVVSLKNRKL